VVEKNHNWLGFETPRGFERVAKYPDALFPQRATRHSAGYDLFSVENIRLRPMSMGRFSCGIKVFMQPDEKFLISLRHSVARKLIILLGSGLIDSDYYNNPDNEGEIFIPIMNLNEHHEFEVRVGDRIAQGVFGKYLLADSDSFSSGNLRKGGDGSTGLGCILE
jgi:dUTP pyrophosphatase